VIKKRINLLCILSLIYKGVFSQIKKIINLKNLNTHTLGFFSKNFWNVKVFKALKRMFKNIFGNIKKFKKNVGSIRNFLDKIHP
jgi:hypothetical protein